MGSRVAKPKESAIPSMSMLLLNSESSISNRIDMEINKHDRREITCVTLTKRVCL